MKLELNNYRILFFHGVTLSDFLPLTPVRKRALQTFSSKILFSIPLKQGLTQFLFIYGIVNWLQHFSLALLLLALNENCSFLLTAMLSEAFHILRDTRHFFQ